MLRAEDDAFSDVYYARKPPHAIKSMDRYGHVIFIKSFSKILSPGCRVAAVVSSGTLISRLVAAKTMADLGSPLLTQKAVLPFIQTNKLDAHLAKLRLALRARRDLAVSTFRRHAPRSVRWTEPDGGLNLWVTLPAPANTTELYLLAQREGIALLPGVVCFAKEAEQQHFRLSFSCMEESVLEDGLIRLCGLLRRYVANGAEAPSV